MLFATPRSSAPRHRRPGTSHPSYRALVVATAVVAAGAGTLQLQPAPAQAAATYGIWSAGTVPHRVADPDSARVTLGVKFSSRVAGRVSGVRFYKSSRNVGPHVGQLWGPRGRLLAKVRFARTTRSGWQTAHFSHPVRITPHRRYTASYTAPNGHYAGDTNALSFARPKVTRYLVAWQGVYAYGSRMPTHNWQASNYYVDVVFTATTKAKPGPVRVPVRTGTSTAPATPSAPVTTRRPGALGRLRRPASLVPATPVCPRVRR